MNFVDLHGPLNVPAHGLELVAHRRVLLLVERVVLHVHHALGL